MDKLKEAFDKVKSDIDFLNKEVFQLKENLSEIIGILQKINKKIEILGENPALDTPTPLSANQPGTGTFPTSLSTHKSPLNSLKVGNQVLSIGNKGVPTDRQTDRQTDRHTLISHGKTENNTLFEQIDNNAIDSAVQILDSLDSIKKEIRLKFKRLTEQEILVFSTIYQIDEEVGYADYKSLANKLHLTESSIRDYVGRLIKKGIPVEKKRIDNKFIKLKISDNLKKIASLPTILQLRGI